MGLQAPSRNMLEIARINTITAPKKIAQNGNMSLVFSLFFGIFTALVVALFETTTNAIFALLCLNSK